MSHVAFVDFDREFNVARVADRPVMPLGKLGCYDEHGIFPLNVLRTDDALFGFIGGWSRRVSVPVDGSIGVAVSRDGGLTFERIGDGPVLTASCGEPFLIGDPFVQTYDDRLHMWYIFGVEWRQYEADAAPERIYKIGHAVSNDGIGWVKDEAGQVVSDSLGEDESQALPSVIKMDDGYHLFFCYRQSFDFRTNAHRSYRIGHAFSTDLRHWVRDDASTGIGLSESGWDSEMLCYPHVFRLDDDVYLMYNGNEFGRYGFGLAKLEA